MKNIRFYKYDKMGYEIKGFSYLSTRILRFFSIPIARSISQTRVCPETIAVISFVFFFFAAFLFATGLMFFNLFGALIFFFAWVLDCVDGDLARLTGRVSVFGEFLDSTIGKIVTPMTYFGICFGLYRDFKDCYIWILGFLVISGFYLFGMASNKIEKITKKYPCQERNLEKNDLAYIEINLLKVFVREISVGHNFLYFLIIIGAILNCLHIVMQMSVVYVFLYSLIIFRQGFLKTRGCR